VEKKQRKHSQNIRFPITAYRWPNNTKSICTLLVQLASLQCLEQENQEAAKQLEDVVAQGEQLLVQVQRALHDIAQSQLHSQMLETSVTLSSASSANSSSSQAQ